MADEFTNRAAQLATQAVETELINATRDYEDAARLGGEDGVSLAADALKRYAQHKREFDELTGANQPQQESGQLSVAQRNFLSRRAAGGDEINQQRMRDYARAHDKALAAGLEPDTPAYFSSIENYVDRLGDGRQPPLNEREAARLCGITEEEYSIQAQKLAAMRARGEYGS